jgi:hypothetical protein
MPTDQVHAFELRLADLTRGEGSLFTSPSGYHPVHGPAPVRRGHRPARAASRPA